MLTYSLKNVLAYACEHVCISVCMHTTANFKKFMEWGGASGLAVGIAALDTCIHIGEPGLSCGSLASNPASWQ